MTRRRAVLAAAVVAVAAVAAAGCGYRLGPGDPVAGARTVALPVFDNRTFRRGVELDLARVLASEVHARTRLSVVDAGADLVVRGVITAIDEDVLSQRIGEVIRESAVLVTVEVTVVDGRTGETLVPRTLITERESFVPAIGESLRSARAETLRRLAADVVDRLEAPDRP